MRLIGTAVAALAAPAAAQTAVPMDEAMLATHCTAGPELVATQRHADGVIAKHGDPAEMSQFMLRASGLAQKCAAETADPGAREWYRFYEANDSFQSALSMKDVGTRWRPRSRRSRPMRRFQPFARPRCKQRRPARLR